MRAALHSAFGCLLLAPLAAMLLAQEPPPDPAQINLHSATAGPKGIKATVSLFNTRYLSCTVNQMDPHTLALVPLVETIDVPLPSRLLETREFVRDTVLIPIAVEPRPEVTYQLVLWARDPDEKAPWSRPQTMPFKGYSPLISDTIRLVFKGTGLEVSALTPRRVVKLAAVWSVAGTEKVDWSAAAIGESPSFTLPYAALTVTGQQVTSTPSLVLGLRDEETDQTQEARITVSVELPNSKDTAGAAAELRKIKDPGTPEKEKEGARFSWKQFAKSGIGAILQYFVVLLA